MYDGSIEIWFRVDTRSHSKESCKIQEIAFVKDILSG